MSVSRREPTEPAASSPDATSGPPADETRRATRRAPFPVSAASLGQSGSLRAIAGDLVLAVTLMGRSPPPS